MAKISNRERPQLTKNVRPDENDGEWIKVTRENCCQLLKEPVKTDVFFHECLGSRGFWVNIKMGNWCGVKSFEASIAIWRDNDPPWVKDHLTHQIDNCPSDVTVQYGCGPKEMKEWDYPNGKYLGKIPDVGDTTTLGLKVKVKVKAVSCCGKESEKEKEHHFPEEF